ncbi:MAG: long-chain fatty acid--CoA ligase [Spirochaetales bacterium]|nr:long-chain fatty acid--CoA ligase [Spirochaetales bacterium]
MIDTIPQLMLDRVGEFPDVACQMEKNAKAQFVTFTYSQTMENVYAVMCALKHLGVRRGDKLGLMSDNRAAWLWADLATLSLGGADVPRGRDSTADEISYILDTVKARISFVENRELLVKMLTRRDAMPSLETVILLDSTPIDDKKQLEAENSMTIHLLSELIEKYREESVETRESLINDIESVKGPEIATIIFTSGTTGTPKGVMIRHESFLRQLECIKDQGFDFHPGQKWLSVLPVWHSFERIVQYISVHSAHTLCYSKPIGKIMLADLQRLNPEYMCSVPRIWETVKAGVFSAMKKEKGLKKAMFNLGLKIASAYTHFRDNALDLNPRYGGMNYLKRFVNYFPYLLMKPLYALFDALVFSKIKGKLGKNFSFGISGGGSLPLSVEEFFRSIGICILNGYGMTETSPVIALQYYSKQTRGVMKILGCTRKVEIRGEKGEVLPPGKKGVIYIEGPQIMTGYYGREDLTRGIIGSDGFINTGDLGIMTSSNEIEIVGRAKDTIVLSGGENIEPVPIEAAMNESSYILSSIVVGQDEKYLSALIVPDAKEIERYLKENKIFYVNRENLNDIAEARQLIDSEIRRLVSRERGFKSFELINKFYLLDRPFEVGRELSAKQEMKRYRIAELYRDEIRSLYS